MVVAPLCLPFQVIDPVVARAEAGPLPLPRPAPQPFKVMFPETLPETLVQVTAAEAPAVPAIATVPDAAVKGGPVQPSRGSFDAYVSPRRGARWAEASLTPPFTQRATNGVRYTPSYRPVLGLTELTHEEGRAVDRWSTTLPSALTAECI